ncbi:MAG: hypothetical protein Q8Q31_05865 [Nanoarchaeota archaeon]|nr:hypothetical protein [Nanoarchaeota archaeon]
MRKTLLNLILAGSMAASSLAGPLELNKALIDNDKDKKEGIYRAEGVMYEAEKLIESRGYKTSIFATKYMPFDEKLPQRRNITFSIYDDTTYINVVDMDSNGMKGGEHRDTFAITHAFSNGDFLRAVFDYMGEGNYKINAMIQDGKSKERFSTFVDSADMNPLVRKVVDFKLRHVSQWGEQLYSELVDAASNDREANIPFEDLRHALGKVEPLLSSIKSEEKDGVGKALITLADEYLNLAKKRVKESKKK